MKEDIRQAKNELVDKGLSLVIVKDNIILYSTTDYGVRGLMEAIEKFGDSLEGSSVVDRVVGKAAAMLCLYARVKEVHAILASETAFQTFDDSNITFTYDKLVPIILNRAKNSQCPFETLTADCVDEKECFQKIKNFIASMQ